MRPVSPNSKLKQRISDETVSISFDAGVLNFFLAKKELLPEILPLVLNNYAGWIL